MKCAIMQPTYLPWAGYFNLISQVDTFVFLDDAQYQKNSWHNRNRILLNKSVHWITVPVKKSSLNQTILTSSIDNTQSWRKKHIKKLQQTYAKSPFSGNVMEICQKLESAKVNNLAELNIEMICWVMSKLDIDTKIMLASGMEITMRRTNTIIEILKILKADTYISPLGSTDYLKEDDFIKKTTVELFFHDYASEPYHQYKADIFTSHLSIVDVVANLGWCGAKQYVG
jgi:hypothetical protein